MRSININILQAVSTLVAAGEITVDELNTAIAEKRGLNMPCGAAKDEHNHFYSFFVATEKEDRTKARRSKDGLRIKFNLRANDVKKTQEAQSPGQVLPQTQGAPALSAETLAAIAQVLAQAGVGQAQAQTKAEPEQSFAQVSTDLKL